MHAQVDMGSRDMSLHAPIQCYGRGFIEGFITSGGWLVILANPPP